MAFYYVTGISGSGKSSIRHELKRRGYQTFGTDEDDLAYFYNNQTGERVGNHVTVEERTPEWRAQHTWKLTRIRAQELAKTATDTPVFLCGVTANDADELWDLFDAVFALFIDEDTLKHRIASRTNDDFGKSAHELQILIEWQKTAKEDYRKLGAVLIDATRPLTQVVDEILQIANVEPHAAPWPKEGPASYFPSIEKKYGRSIAEWQDIIANCGTGKHMQIVDYLKSEYGMGHGHANALVGWTLAGNQAI